MDTEPLTHQLSVDEENFPLPIRFAGTFTAQNVFGEAGHLPEVIQIVAPFNRDAAIQVCTTWMRDDFINRIRNSWARQISNLIYRLIPTRFRFRAELIAGDDSFFQSPFSEISLLALIALICRYSRKDVGGLVETKLEQQGLFRALLILQGATFPPDFKKLEVPEQFRYTTSTILATGSTQNDWGLDLARLHALLSVPEVGKQLLARAGMTVSQWFERRLGCPGEDYMALANTFFGAYFCGADISGAPAALRPAFERFRDLCSTTPEEVVHGVEAHPQADPNEAFEATKYANRLVVRPVISLGDRYLLASPGLFFNKFHRGLPYLCLEAGVSPRESGARPRSEFGYIFEGYFNWLLTQWFNPKHLHLNFFVGKRSNPAEQDATIILGDTALIFETKATVPPLAVRSLAEPDAVAKLLNTAALQLERGAKALIDGTAWEIVDGKRTPLPQVARVIPIAVVFEFFPVRWPYSDSFESVLEANVGVPVFRAREGILPMQVLDIQDVERWEDFFNFPADEGRLIDSLASRTSRPRTRWQPLGRGLTRRNDFNERPGILRRLLQEAELASSERIKQQLLHLEHA